jgi:cytochrome b6-f complex iron-sulfur subunit
MKTLNEIKMGNLSLERRDFLKKTGAVGVMSMFGLSFFTSCSSEDDSPNNDNTNPPAPSTGIVVQNDQVLVDLDVASVLKNTGGWALVIQAQVLIVNVGGSDFNAMTSVCTHSGCDRNWTFSNNVFTCTCHDSRFRTDGSVVNGPALQPLRSYPTKVSGRTLTVDLG